MPFDGRGVCCEMHQDCYYECGVQKKRCDDEFILCLENLCEDDRRTLKTETKKKDSKTMKMRSEDDLDISCRMATKTIVVFKLALSCFEFKKIQDSSCKCSKINDEL